MADIIEGHKAEISELCEEVEKGIKEIQKGGKHLTAVKKSDKINYLKNRIGRAKTALRSMKVEMRELPKLEAKPHQDKAAQLEEKIKQLEVDIDYAEKSDPADSEKQQAMATDYKAVLAEGAAIQTDDINRLQRVQQKIAETTEIGTNTLAKQQEQREQIIRVDQGVDQVSSNIKLANRHLRVFVRRIATDKLIMGFMFLIFVGIIVIIVVSIVKPDTKTNVPQSWRRT
jgi:SNARE protein